MTYTLTHNGQVICGANTLDAIWKSAVRECGHMTLAAFTERGYAIQAAGNA